MLLLSTISLLLLPGSALADQILKTSGFSTCLESASDITVQKVDIQYNRDSQTVTFDVAGTSSRVQNVSATLNVQAYGSSVYRNEFNPCAPDTFVSQLCPVPSGSFAATGTQKIPPAFATLVPDIAFAVPDISAEAKLELKALDGKPVACITSQVSNGKSVSVPAVSYVAAGIAGVALVMTGVSALGVAAGGGSTVGAGTMSPSIGEVIGVFQGFAMNGMLSVDYPPVVRQWSKNFAFSTGLIPWTTMQMSIDSFRQATGGNLTEDSVQFLTNTTVVFNSTRTKRDLAGFMNSYLAARQTLSTSINDTTVAPAVNGSKLETTASGIKAFAEQLAVPEANTFMTVLLIVAVIMATIAVSILLFKVILEAWALLAPGSYPKSLVGFRKHYWNTMARTLVQLILVLYGVWVLWSLLQLKSRDSSWATKVLAGVTLALFTGVLAFFCFKIWQTARRLKQADGDTSGLYYNKETWLKYSIFYDSYKKDAWFLFLPVIIYMLAKGAIIATADGHGLTQTAGQLIVEALMLGLLVIKRPYERKSGNVINIFIQVVRVLSVVCILVFVQELGLSQTTKTVTGVVLIAVQSVLTATLAILIAANAIVLCVKENPHRKRRKEAEKRNREFDNLTPLDARNSLLVSPMKVPTNTTYESDPNFAQGQTNSNDSFMREPANPYAGAMPLRPYMPQIHPALRSDESRENLVRGAAPLGGAAGSPPQQMRQPRLPDVSGYGGGYRGAGY